MVPQNNITMKSFILSTLVTIASLKMMFGQTNDSLVHFSELKFHSAFEQKSISNWVRYKKDTFNLFLCIDKNMTDETAEQAHNTFLFNIKELQEIKDKKLGKKIKTSYTYIHSRYLRKYNALEYFPVLFQTGNYNCVTATILYALVFNEFNIPYRVKESPNHVYLIANPGTNSVVIETTNPVFEESIFNGDFKRQYVEYLRSSKLISNEECQSKSTEEIFEQKFYEVKDAAFENLPGFQYYNRAVEEYEKSNYELAYRLCQKAYFFYPDPQIWALLYNSLLFKISKIDFDNVEDIDYLAQYARFDNVDFGDINKIFINIINHHLQYIGKESYCDSLYNRFIPQIEKKGDQNELIFSYNMLMSYHYQSTDNVVQYVTKALEIKSNFNDANIIFKNYLLHKFFTIKKPDDLLNMIDTFERKYKFKEVSQIYYEERLRAYLTMAKLYYDKSNVKEGDKYLNKFETLYTIPVNINSYIIEIIEQAYSSGARFYYIKKNNVKARSYATRGLKFAPSSYLLKSFLK
jgi:hypothetical protein